MSSEAPPGRGGAELMALGLTALVILVADQVTKALIIANLALGERVEVVGDLAILWHVQNSGASFSLFRFDGNVILFYAVTVVALGMVWYFHRSFRGRSPWLQVVLGIFLGGSLGNLIDRVRFGYVTDFISIGFGDTRFPTWNVADAGITTGITLLVIYLLFFESRRAEARA